MLAAGNFGVPQGRWRCFMWAAAPGQALPPAPKPTHNCLDFQCPIAKHAKRITSGFVGEAEAADAFPPVLLGDIFSDLPEVDNFELHERRRYAGPPNTLTQAWLRREPRPWMTPRQDRFQAHEDYMHAEHVSARCTGAASALNNLCSCFPPSPPDPAQFGGATSAGIAACCAKPDI
jgi:DNA (cytosine-5)-methyltransferase 1